MLISQSILNQFCSNFGFYISWPILTNYMIPGGCQGGGGEQVGSQGRVKVGNEY